MVLHFPYCTNDKLTGSVTMPTIQLTKGQVAIVDDSDYEALKQYSWWTFKHTSGKLYAARTSPRSEGNKTILMHRQILDAPKGKVVDHDNGNGLDNRRSNIKVCTQQENMYNTKGHNKYKGVSWDKKSNKWRAQIRIDGKVKNLGVFVLDTDAAEAYRAAEQNRSVQRSNIL